MGETLADIARKLKDINKKVQLIYAFNGSGKTRLSREFKNLVAPKDADEGEDALPQAKILYYNAFTEDLFSWENSTEGEFSPKLTIKRNDFTDWILIEQGKDGDAISNFQKYAGEAIMPRFEVEYKDGFENGKKIRKATYPAVTFSIQTGSDDKSGNIKISRGEESNFVWSIFFSLIDEIVTSLGADNGDLAGEFEDLEYVFIDDPVSSLDDNHLIQLAVDLAQLVKRNKSDLKFIISTHNPLFFNIMWMELKNDDSNIGWKRKYHHRLLLEHSRGDQFTLSLQDRNTTFSYHLFLLEEVKQAIDSGDVRKYHFAFMRNIMEKAAMFFGSNRWENFLPKNDDGTIDEYAQRLANFGAHSRHPGDEVAPTSEQLTEMLEKIYDHFVGQGHQFMISESPEIGKADAP